MISRKVVFYGLLHIAENESSSVQLSGRSFVDQIAVYLKNASTLASSLEKAGYGFFLLTNKADELREILTQLTLPSLKVEQISFTREIPSGIRFYSAHFKLDVYQYFAALDNHYSVLCDLDMLCTGKKLKIFQQAVESETPLYYNITDQVSYGKSRDVAYDDIHLIEGKSEGIWCGGEFIGGTSSFFKSLAAEVDNIFPNYIKVIDQVSHVGDEAVTSVALQRLRQKGTHMIDAGPVSIVGRFWNCSRSLSYQRHANFYEGCFLLHLPADKEFLAELAGQNVEDYVRCFKHYRLWSVQSMKIRVKRVVRWLLRKPE